MDICIEMYICIYGYMYINVDMYIYMDICIYVYTYLIYDMINNNWHMK